MLAKFPQINVCVEVKRSENSKKVALWWSLNVHTYIALCVSISHLYRLSLAVMHTILTGVKSVWEDDVCFVNPVLFDRFRGLTHYWGNDRHVFDKQDQALPSDTPAFILSLETQRSL